MINASRKKYSGEYQNTPQVVEQSSFAVAPLIIALACLCFHSLQYFPSLKVGLKRSKYAQH